MAGSQNMTSQGPHESGPPGQSGLNASGTVVRESRRDLAEPRPADKPESHRLVSAPRRKGSIARRSRSGSADSAAQNGIERKVNEAI